MSYSLFFLAAIIIIHGSQAFYRQKRIVQGVDAREGEFPYQVSIQNTDSNYHHCGGIIIDQSHVLTAAHCVDGFFPEEFQVISGTVDLRTPATTHYVSDIFVHENFNQQDSWRDDIALIKVSQPFYFNDVNVAPAILPSQSDDVPVNSKAVVTGFGRTVVQGASSKTLKKTEITVTNLEFCNIQYKKIFKFRESQICTYDKEAKGMCKGDSGGPLIFKRKVVGIVSFANGGCVDSKYPSVFTKVSKYIDWIHSHIKA